MLNENAKKWVEALRSGRFTQAKGVLSRFDGYSSTPEGDCCLGVACKLFIEDGGDLKAIEDFSDGTIAYEAKDGNVARTLLPWVVQDWLGLQTADGMHYGSTERTLAGGNSSLAGMNDAGRTFEQIADVIESEPEGLFTA